jgi:hypothetical protein
MTKPISSRSVFYVQAFTVALCIVAGMSESFSWLRWAKPLIPLAALLFYGNLVIPLVILAKSKSESRTRFSVAAAVTLSLILSIASFYAILPLCM